MAENVLKKAIWLLMVVGVGAMAFTDMDLDGVDDKVDQCPNTPFTDIVDEKGCPIETVAAVSHYDLIVGLAYSQYDYRLDDDTDTLTTSVQADYYRGNLSVQLATSFYKTDGGDYDESGMNDTSLAAYYAFKNVWKPGLTLQVGGGLIFPTYDAAYDNNNLDAFVSMHLDYKRGAANVFGGYTFTAVGDDDVVTDTFAIRYQNTNAFNLGAGYTFSPKIYASVSYFHGDSIYESVDATESLSLYGFYSVDAHWFVTGSYAYGLNDSTSDNYLALRLGYYF
ncbi:MAG: DUF3187 domain-containing protein [Epsilonproteobacteria bacterium]|nr:DUF3187 domain-containing protein [Campylobacterota bacterium]